MEQHRILEKQLWERWVGWDSKGAKDGSLKVSQSETTLPKAPFTLLGQYKVPLVKHKFLKSEIEAKLSMNRWELMIKAQSQRIIGLTWKIPAQHVHT